MYVQHGRVLVLNPPSTNCNIATLKSTSDTLLKFYCNTIEVMKSYCTVLTIEEYSSYGHSSIAIPYLTSIAVCTRTTPEYTRSTFVLIIIDVNYPLLQQPTTPQGTSESTFSTLVRTLSKQVCWLRTLRTRMR